MVRKGVKAEDKSDFIMILMVPSALFGLGVPQSIWKSYTYGPRLSLQPYGKSSRCSSGKWVSQRWLKQCSGDSTLIRFK